MPGADGPNEKRWAGAVIGFERALDGLGLVKTNLSLATLIFWDKSFLVSIPGLDKWEHQDGTAEN